MQMSLASSLDSERTFTKSTAPAATTVKAPSATSTLLSLISWLPWLMNTSPTPLVCRLRLFTRVNTDAVLVPSPP